MRTFVELAKLDHIVFKKEVYKVLMGVSDKSAADFSSHTECRLGKWYLSGEGHDCFSKLPAYSKIDAPHREVHEHGKSSIEEFQAGEFDGAIRHIERMEQASNQVLQFLESLAQQGESNRCAI